MAFWVRTIKIFHNLRVRSLDTIWAPKIFNSLMFG